MTIPEITSLIEKAKQATPGTKMLVHASTGKHIYSHLDNGLVRCIAKDLHTHDAEYFFAANPEAILSLAQSYLEAVEIIKEIAEITSDVDEQGYRYDWMQHVDSFTFQPVRLFLKKVGCDE